MNVQLCLRIPFAFGKKTGELRHRFLMSELQKATGVVLGWLSIHLQPAHRSTIGILRTRTSRGLVFTTSPRRLKIEYSLIRRVCGDPEGIRINKTAVVPEMLHAWCSGFRSHLVSPYCPDQ